jgi:hypothetical protein
MTRTHPLFLTIALLGLTSAVPACASAQNGDQADGALLPAGYGSLSQSDLALRVRNDEIEVRFVPLDQRVTRLLAKDAYESLNSLVLSRRRQIDSVASIAGISRPGLALVTFFALRAAATYDPQTLTLSVRNRVYRPLGIVPITPRFTAQQLGVREQVSAIYLFEEEIPVTDAFSLAYRELTSEDWSRKQTTLSRERARVSARARVQRPEGARGEQTDSL